MNKYDSIIIGGGPAGVSSALYLTRAGMRVLLIENGAGALAKAHRIDNFYGTSAEGKVLYEQGLAQAAALGVTVLHGEATSLDYYDMYTLTVHGQAEQYSAPTAVLATGSKNITLDIPGLAQFEGRGVSYCAVCDGFFFRKKRVAVLGAGPYALHEADYLKNLASEVTILTNGQNPSDAINAGFSANASTIATAEGDGKLQSITFTDGSKLEIDGLFLALGTADSTAIARKLGAELNGRFIKIDEHCATNVPGLFAAGDCTGGLMQVAKAVYEGAEAGLAAVRFIRKQAAVN